MIELALRLLESALMFDLIPYQNPLTRFECPV
jgi:hypothetical protein